MKIKQYQVGLPLSNQGQRVRNAGSNYELDLRAAIKKALDEPHI